MSWKMCNSRKPVVIWCLVTGKSRARIPVGCIVFHLITIHLFQEILGSQTGGIALIGLVYLHISRDPVLSYCDM